MNYLLAHKHIIREELAMQRIFDEQRQPCEEYEDYLSEIRKHIDEPAPKVTIKGGDGSGFVSNIDTVLRKQNLTIDEFNTLRLKSVSELSPDEIAKMKAIRDSVPKIKSSTVIKKTIPASDIEKYSPIVKSTWTSE